MAGFIPPLRPVSRNHFYLAVLCALPLEAGAVDALFDHVWDDRRDKERPFGKSPGDPNAYTLGVIGRHNVVLVHLPEMGVASAAAAASAVQMSFPKITLGVVVGVCGVMPGTDAQGRDRVLGDVIISTGAVHYEAGRLTDEGLKHKTSPDDNLRKLPSSIKALLNSLKIERSQNDLEEEIRETLQQNTKLKASYPGKAHDHLFQADYKHGQDWETSKDLECHEVPCDQGKLVMRQRLLPDNDDPAPAVHFGIIATGSKVIRSAEERDKVAKQHSAIAFEMEGAGAWDVFPFVVIKGFCDYADSHKNKTWQPYAAAVAACCLKAFLWSWTPPESV